MNSANAKRLPITEEKLFQMAAEAVEVFNLRVIKIILIPEKFLQLDWLRAGVFPKIQRTKILRKRAST